MQTSWQETGSNERATPAPFIHLSKWLLCGLIALTLTVPLKAQDVLAEPPLTGTKLARQLKSPIGLTWSGRGLRSGLQRLAEQYQIAIILDRRIDPGIEIDLSLTDVPLEEGLRRIADQAKLGITRFGGVTYLGPKKTTDRLRTLATNKTSELKQLAPKRHKKLSTRHRLAWKDLTTPQELLDRIEKQYNMKIDNRDKVPHDLWPAAELPPLSMTHQLTTVLSGFGLTFQYASEERTLHLIPMPAEATITRSYRGGTSPEILAKKYAQLAPNADISIEKGRIIVRARLEDHERLRPPKGRRTANPRTNKSPQPAKVLVTLKVREATVEQLLQHFAKQLKLELRIDREAIKKANLDLQQRVSIDLKNASIDDLLQATLKGTGLSFRRTDKVVEVSPEG